MVLKIPKGVRSQMKRLTIFCITLLIASLAFSLETASNEALSSGNVLALTNNALSSNDPLPSAQGAVLYTDTLNVVKGGILALSHKGLVEGSEKVVANGRFLKRNVDYIIDYANGTLLLSGEVRATTLIVSYLYDPNKQNQPSNGLPLQLALTGGSSTTLNLLTYFRPGSIGQNGAETWLAGSHLTTNLSPNATLKSLFFISRIATPTSYVAGLARSGVAPIPEQKGKAIANWLDLNLGKGKLSLFFQDIDKDFSAPQEMPNNLNGNDISFLKQEAGARKMGIGYQNSNLSLSFLRQTVDPQARGDQGVGKEKGLTKQILNGQFKLSDSLSFSALWKSATDGNGEGLLKQIELKGKDNEFLRLTHQRISSNFVRGGSLNEPEAGVWAKEVGISRDALELSKKLLPDLLLNFSKTTIKDERGEIERIMWSLKGKNFSLAVKNQGVGSNFTRFGNLTEGDAGQLAKERGLARQTVEGTFNLSPKLQTSFSLASIKDASNGNEGWRGNNFQLKSDKWEIFLIKSQFTDGFRRFGDLTDPEKKMFANEWGIKKSLLQGNFKLDNLLPGLTLSLASRNLSDSQGGLENRSIELKLKDQPFFRFSTQRIDPTFTRFGDLAEQDKDRLAQERSAEKKDIFLALPITKNLAFSTSITKVDSLDTTRSDAMWGKSTLHSVNNLAWTGKDNLKAFLTWDATRQDGDKQRTNDIYNLIIEKAFKNANLKVQRMQGLRTEGDQEFRSALTILNLNHSLRNNASYSLNLTQNKLENGNKIEEGNLNINAPLLKGNAGSISYSFKQSAEQSFRSIALVQPLDSQSQFKGEIARLRQGDQEGKKEEFSLSRTFLPGLTGNLAYGIQSLGSNSSSYRLLQTTYQPQGAPYKMSFTIKDRSGGNNTTTRGIDITYPFQGKDLTLSMLKNPEDQNGNPIQAKRVAIQFQGSPVLSGQYILDTNYMNGKLNKQYSLQFTPSQKFNLKLSLLDNVPDPNQKLMRKLNWEIAFPINDKLSFKGTHNYDFIERENKGVYKTLFALSGKLSTFEMLDASLCLDYSSLAGDKVGGITYRFSYSRNVSADNSLAFSGYYTDNFKGKNDVGLRIDLTRAF